MPNIITSSIEAALAGDGINYIDLVRIKLYDSTHLPTLFWSSRPVPESLSCDGTIYEARIKSIDPLTFKAGLLDSTINIAFDNTDNLVCKTINNGLIWEQAEVSICRLFPDIALPNAEGSFLGLPEDRVTGMAEVGTATTLTTSVHDSVDEVSKIEPSWLILIKEKMLIGRVSSTSGRTITVDYWRTYGDSQPSSPPEIGDSWISGPEYTNRIGTWSSPYWWGWIKQAPTFEVESRFKVSPSFLEMSREALRRYDRTCPAVFGSEHFPYNPLNGKGLPKNVVSGIATGGTQATPTAGPTLTTDTDIRKISNNWRIFVYSKNPTYPKVSKKIIGEIESFSGNTITVKEWRHGGSVTETIPEEGDSWICGPDYTYTDYDGTLKACINMGMFGPNSQQSPNELNTDIRRYFYALTIPTSTSLQSGTRTSSLASSLRSTADGDSNDGEVIPVRIGKFECKLTPLAWGIVENGGYIHSLGAVGEGRCKVLQIPLLDGKFYPDEDDPGDPDYRNPWIEGGTDYYSDSNDSNAVNPVDDDGELTLSQKNQCIGSLQSRTRGNKPHEVLNTYSNNPFGFNDYKGDGCSLAGLTWVRTRFQREGYSTSSAPEVRIRGTGILVEKSDKTWTEAPNAIDVFYYFLKNQLWGAGLSLSRLNTIDFTTQSAKANETILPQGSVDRNPSGALEAGPTDISSDRTVPMTTVIVPSPTFTSGETINGKSIELSNGTEETHVFYIQSHYIVPAVIPVGTPGNYITCNIQNTGILLNLDTPLNESGYFDNSAIPKRQDIFYLNTEEEVNTRYPANGSLSQDASVSTMAEEILKNCNATYIMKNGRISPVIRDDVGDLSSVRTFSDCGENRNIVYRSGESTLKFTPTETGKIPTSVRVEFIDINQCFEKRQITIRNTYAENRIRILTGEDAREKKVTILPLCLTGSAERAVRLGVLYLREHSFIESHPRYHPGQYSLEVPIHYAQDLIPIEDVVCIQGRNLPEWSSHMRVTELVDNYDKGTVTIKGTPYFSEMYSDGDTDIILVSGPPITIPTGNESLPLVINKLTEGHFRDLEGQIKVTVTGEITLP